MPKVTGKLNQKKNLPQQELEPASPLPAFITGSRAYGTPRENSDTDLVVFMELEEYKKFSLYAEGAKSKDMSSEDSNTMDDRVTKSLVFGKLNIIPVVDKLVYKAWKEGTEFLKTQAPVTKSFAITVLENYKEKALKNAKSNRKAQD